MVYDCRQLLQAKHLGTEQSVTALIMHCLHALMALDTHAPCRSSGNQLERGKPIAHSSGKNISGFESKHATRNYCSQQRHTPAASTIAVRPLTLPGTPRCVVLPCQNRRQNPLMWPICEFRNSNPGYQQRDPYPNTHRLCDAIAENKSLSSFFETVTTGTCDTAGATSSELAVRAAQLLRLARRGTRVTAAAVS